MEEWKDIAGYEGLYKISNKGNEVKVGNDYDFADFVNAVYANDGWFFLDEK